MKIAPRQYKSFVDFLVAPFNQEAHEAARSIVTAAATPRLLCIVGASGNGKTHLIEALAGAFLVANPTAKVLLLTAESFMNRLIMEERSGTFRSFLSGFVDLDLLVVEDLGVLASCPRTSSALAEVFLTLAARQRQVVVTISDQPETVLGPSSPLTRLLSEGVTVTIGVPDLEACVRIVRQKATELGLDLDDDGVHRIAVENAHSIRACEGAVVLRKVMDGAD